MNRAQGQNFDWSNCKLTNGGNRAFLKGECDFIAGEWERKYTWPALPTFLAVAVYAVLSYKTPDWFSIPIALLVWTVGFSHEMEQNRILARLTPNATLLKGEVKSVKESNTGDYGDDNCRLIIGFQNPEGQTFEKSTDARGNRATWSIGDQVVILFADADNFWVL